MRKRQAASRPASMLATPNDARAWLPAGQGRALDRLGGNPAGVPGHQIGEVRIHSGPEASRLADEVGARAFTVGNHIVFGSGEFNPATRAGQRLLNHELAHVQQNRKLGSQALPLSTRGSNAAERQAERAADAGGASLSLERSEAPAALLQRQDLHEKEPIPNEHPEVAGIPSVRLRNFYRIIYRDPRRFLPFLREAAIDEGMMRQRVEEGTAGGSTRIIQDGSVEMTTEGASSPMMIIHSDPTALAMDLVGADPAISAELSRMPHDVQMRYLELLGQRLIESAIEMMQQSPGFAHEVRKQVRIRSEANRRRRSRPRRLDPVVPQTGSTIG